MFRGNNLQIPPIARKGIPVTRGASLFGDRARYVMHRSGLFLLVALLLVAFAPAIAPAMSAASHPSPTIPVSGGNLVAFFSLPRDPVAGSAAGRLVSFSMPDRGGYAEMVLADGQGVEHCIAWRGGRRCPCLVPNAHYGVTVEHHVFPATSSSIVIRDEQGIVYAGATDRLPGENVLKRGLAGFAIAIEGVETGTEPALRVDHEGVSASLHAGDSARLGSYEVICISLPASGDAGAPVAGASALTPGLTPAGVLSWIIVRDRAGEDEENLADFDADTMQLRR